MGLLRQQHPFFGTSVPVVTVILAQAAALVGAFWTGQLAHRRREQMEVLNAKLRAINSELRRQYNDAGGGGDIQPSLLAEAAGAGAEAEASGGDPEAAAKEVMEAAAAEMSAVRDALEVSLAAPSAAHPWERLGPNGRLSLAGARRRIAAAIRDCKLLLRQAAATEAPASTAAAPHHAQLAAAGYARPTPSPASGSLAGLDSATSDPMRRCFSLLDEAESLGNDMKDKRAVLAAVHLRAKALRQAKDPEAASRELERCLALAADLGQPEGADVLGELGDVLTEMGDYAAAADAYDRCIASMEAEPEESALGTLASDTWC